MALFSRENPEHALVLGLVEQAKTMGELVPQVVWSYARKEFIVIISTLK